MEKTGSELWKSLLKVGGTVNTEELRKAPIGVFDSGVGGLTVAREIMRQLPDENIVYFGDTARLPYGSKSKESIIRFAKQIIRFLQTKKVKAIVIACNTATAQALEAVQKERYPDHWRDRAGSAGSGQRDEK